MTPLDFSNLFGTPQEAVEEEIVEEVVEQPEEETPAVEEQPEPLPELPEETEDDEEEEPVEVKKEKTPNEKAIKFLLKHWEDKGVTQELLESEEFSHIVDAVATLKAENDKLKADKKSLEKHPIIQEAKIQQKIEKIWEENINSWNDELTLSIPDEVKIISKLGKTKINEVITYIQAESRKLLEDGIKSGRTVSNPLTILAPKIAKKINEVSGTQPKEEQKPKADAKKMMSLQGGASMTQQPASMAPQEKPKPSHLTPLQAKLLGNMGGAKF